MIIRNGARKHVPNHTSDYVRELLNLPINRVKVNTSENEILIKNLIMVRDVIDEIWCDDDDEL